MSDRIGLLTERFRQARSTPGRLRVAAAAVALAALVFCLAVLGAVRAQRHGMQTIGVDAAPSIIAAEQIKSDLADMHSQVANILLKKPGQSAAAVKDYESRRTKAVEGILKAAGNVTYGDAERVPLQTLMNGLGPYEAAVARARLLHERGDPAFLAEHETADRIMHHTLLKAATALDDANRKALDEEYEQQQRTSWLGLLGVLLSGGLLLGVLVVVQRFLYRRMRRVLNLGLVAATVVAVVFVIYTVAVLRLEADDLKVAKKDAFESIHALWHARAEAYDANGEESRWLLDRAHAAEYEKAFDDKAKLLANVPGGPLRDQVEKALLLASQERLPADFAGYLADELRNITFNDEREAATDTLQKFLGYVAIDARIRKLENGGKHAEAVALCVGNNPGESNWAFDQFDKALEKTLQINDKEFKAAVAHGFAALNGFEVTAPLAALAVALLSFVGLLPRLREYAA